MKAKAVALAGLLLIGLLPVGWRVHWAVKESNKGLLALSTVSLPEQHAIEKTIRNAVSSRLELFRLVSGFNNGAELKPPQELGLVLAREADRVSSLLEGALAPASTEAGSTALAQARTSWRRYAAGLKGELVKWVRDPASAIVVLGLTDKQYRSALADLEAVATLAAGETATRTASLVAAGAQAETFLLAAALFTAVLVLLSTGILIHFVVGPVGRITRAMTAISHGDPGAHLLGEDRSGEVGEMARAVRRFQERLTQREHDLRTQNYRFQVLTDHMIQALSMFDAEQRLIIMNRRYAEMFKLPDELTRPGVTLREIREFRVKAGCAHVGDTAAFVNGDLTGSKPRAYVSELVDGRFLSFRSVPMADGGWVGTHDDVTELHKTQQSLAEERSRLNTALQNMSHGLAMFDKDRNLIVCNARYGELYGIPGELMRPGTNVQRILADLVANEVFAGNDPEKHIQEKISDANVSQSSNAILELRDGRMIAASYRSVAGGGWVSTHEDVTERRKAEVRIAHLARHDALTELPNRLLFRERMERVLSRVRRHGEQVAVHCLDLDHFKAVNDTLGHPVGDLLLRQVAQRLKICLRDSDTVARLGGDEFAVLQVGEARSSHAARFAHRLVEVISAPYDLDGHHVVIGASIGISVGPNDGADPDQLLKNADMALYRAKADGRGTFRFFEAEMDAVAQRRRALEIDLRKALSKDEFELFYQPIVNSRTGKIASFEALIRWNHPERGRVSPGDFIPLAEEIGLIVPMGEWILRQACAEAATWPDHIKVAVNLSPVQFRNKGLLQEVRGALAAARLPAQRLDVEITESVLLEAKKATLATLHGLRKLGVGVSMDDFGTGYSSLSYLRSFPFDKIKIDQSFVQDLGRTDDADAIVRAVTSLGASLGMTIVAEGVETREQFDLLRKAGCTEVQGYLISKPVSAAKLRLLLPQSGLLENVA